MENNKYKMTAREFLKYKYENYEPSSSHLIDMSEYAKLKCKELLEIVAENADIYIPDGAYMDCYVNPNFIEIDKTSILNAVDLNEFIK